MANNRPTGNLSIVPLQLNWQKLENLGFANYNEYQIVLSIFKPPDIVKVIPFSLFVSQVNLRKYRPLWVITWTYMTKLYQIQILITWNGFLGRTNWGNWAGSSCGFETLSYAWVCWHQAVGLALESGPLTGCDTWAMARSRPGPLLTSEMKITLQSLC